VLSLLNSVLSTKVTTTTTTWWATLLMPSKWGSKRWACLILLLALLVGISCREIIRDFNSVKISNDATATSSVGAGHNTTNTSFLYTTNNDINSTVQVLGSSAFWRIRFRDGMLTCEIGANHDVLRNSLLDTTQDNFLMQYQNNTDTRSWTATHRYRILT
jgi:hypothetical protein